MCFPKYVYVESFRMLLKNDQLNHFGVGPNPEAILLVGLRLPVSLQGEHLIAEIPRGSCNPARRADRPRRICCICAGGLQRRGSSECDQETLGIPAFANINTRPFIPYIPGMSSTTIAVRRRSSRSMFRTFSLLKETGVPYEASVMPLMYV